MGKKISGLRKIRGRESSGGKVTVGQAREDAVVLHTRAAAVGIERNAGVGERFRGRLRGHGGGE